ncbi:hypothetical protein C8D77_111162 [Mesorhizobium loti]|uniref:Uncharacterized protein n=1 Tax=Rhizobium loti TaxID=381 RepID=A0A8E2WAJ5_RHILI|nr:hypothetical protein [Mesorhizobium loti]PWJ88439.1 hypothetical protein C8D77_111162 [Mesorhizobium loti]
MSIDKLIERLRIKAGMIEMGEKIAWGSDSALMYEAASALASTQAEILRLRQRVAALEYVLEPFAAQAATHGTQIPDEMFIDDYEQPTDRPWKSAAGITVGQLRRAARSLSQDGPAA